MSSDSRLQGQNPAPVNQPAPSAPSAAIHPPAPLPQSIPILSNQTAAELDEYLQSILALPPVEPWPEPVDGAQLLDDILLKISGSVVLPRWAPETLTLWVPHTFGFQYRDITTYIGLESPEHRCGKSTLITI